MVVPSDIIPNISDYAEIARRPLEAEQCALIVIDIQEKLLPPIFQKEQLVRNSQLLVRPLIFLKFLRSSARNMQKDWEPPFLRLLPCYRAPKRSIKLCSRASTVMLFAVCSNVFPVSVLHFSCAAWRAISA